MVSERSEPALNARLSEALSDDDGEEVDDRWAKNSDYGLSDRQIQEAARSRPPAPDKACQGDETSRGRADDESSLWTALLAELPFLAELAVSCAPPCSPPSYATNLAEPKVVSRLPCPRQTDAGPRRASEEEEVTWPELGSAAATSSEGFACDTFRSRDSLSSLTASRYHVSEPTDLTDAADVAEAVQKLRLQLHLEATSIIE
ncbi:unnamed protein product [Polarella glacialis]|uniref:Uncharacterized protein n=1 Tax=Polarella glacialis TaxID=89957 RepID=A0A813EGY2_POLGL|nr:unnamed protein product [Polarella glacialis]